MRRWRILGGRRGCRKDTRYIFEVRYSVQVGGNDLRIEPALAVQGAKPETRRNLNFQVVPEHGQDKGIR